MVSPSWMPKKRTVSGHGHGGSRVPRQASLDLSGFDWDDDPEMPPETCGEQEQEQEQEGLFHGREEQDGAEAGATADGPQMNMGAIYSAVRRHSSTGSTAAGGGANDASSVVFSAAGGTPSTVGGNDGGNPTNAYSSRRVVENDSQQRHSSKKPNSGGTAPTVGSRTSRTFSSTSSSVSIWTRILFPMNDGLWDGVGGCTFDTDEDDLLEEGGGEDISYSERTRRCCLSFFYEGRHFIRTCRLHPIILLYSLLASAVLCAVGVAAVHRAHESAVCKSQHTATCIATETAGWFAEELRKAMTPLYSVQQAVVHSGYFDDIPSIIGPFPERVIPGTNDTFVKRDVSGICDDPDLMQKWRDIVEPVNHNNDLDGVVVGYRLFPSNVACLTEPNDLMGSSDFFNVSDFVTPGAPLANDFVFGFDVGHDVNSPLAGLWKMITTDVYVEKNFNIFGPFEMPPMTELLCGHLPIWLPPGPDGEVTSVLDVHGTEVPNAYGMVVNFLDWTKLKDRSGIYDRFAGYGLEFCLTKGDGGDDPAHDVVLATSEQCSALDDSNSIFVETESLQGIWRIRVGQVDGWGLPWYPYAIAAVVLGSLLVGLLAAAALAERQQHRNLLYKVIPPRAVAKIERGQTVLEKFKVVTVFFSDIVGFTSLAGGMTPVRVMKMLNELYTELDRIVDKYGVYKVETIGDAYMVVGGAPDRRPAPDAAERVALFALEAVDFVRNFRTMDGDKIFIRAGLASGPVCAGVVGKAMPRYCFFGDTVNFASRMESTSDEMRIQCAEMTYRLLLDAPNSCFALEERLDGEGKGVEVKGKGHVNSYWITGASKRTPGNNN